MALAETMRPAPKELRANLEALRNTPYPGRGFVMGLNERGDMGIQVYWITARSPDSQNRVILEDDGFFRTEVFDPSKLQGDQDPNLLIYSVTATAWDNHVISNGEQTDAIADSLSRRKDWEEELGEWSFEGDSLHTPRISGVLRIGNHPKFLFSKIREGSSGNTEREFYNLTKFIKPGIGYAIQTYQGEDEHKVMAFEGEPYPLPIGGNDVREIAKKYWDIFKNKSGLKTQRVALLVVGIDLKTGEVDFKVQNSLGDSSPSSAKFRA